MCPSLLPHLLKRSGSTLNPEPTFPWLSTRAKRRTLHPIPFAEMCSTSQEGWCQGIPSYATCNTMMEAVHQSVVQRPTKTQRLRYPCPCWMNSGNTFLVCLLSESKNPLDHWLSIGFQLQVPLQRLNWAHLENKIRRQQSDKVSFRSRSSAG